MSKKIYFVRHGESLSIAAKKNQDAEVSLSPKGIEQATAVAGRFSTIRVKAIYSSPYKRALQTAEIISQAIHIPVVINDLLKEGKRPSFFENKSFDDPEVVSARNLIHEHSNDPAWHHSDEENLFDLRDRMISLRTFLEHTPEQRFVVVCHAGVMRMLSLVLVFDKLTTPDLFMASYHHTKISQTGLTVFEFGEHGWRLLTWNDYAHLGDTETDIIHA